MIATQQVREPNVHLCKPYRTPLEAWIQDISPGKDEQLVNLDKRRILVCYDVESDEEQVIQNHMHADPGL